MTITGSITLALALLAGAAWIGEVVTLNFIIVPSLLCMPEKEKASFLSRFFPRFFRMASVLALTSILMGGTALFTSVPVHTVAAYLYGGQGLLLSLGITLILVLSAFHFVVESRLRPLALSLQDNPEPRKIRFLTRFLSVVPRIGIFIITAGYSLITLALIRLL